MKFILAGIYGFAMLILFVILLLRFETLNPFLVIFVGILYFVGICVLGSFLFRDRDKHPRISSEEIFEVQKDLTSLEKEGLLKRTKYRVKRYFTVGVDKDVGIYYFLELDNRQIFCVGEVMLYCCPQETWDKVHELFPTTEFTVVEHRTFGFVRNIEFGGDLLPPEHKFPEESMSYFADNEEIKGGFISKMTYKALVKEMKKASVR